jgi:hypothetical protein
METYAQSKTEAWQDSEQGEAFEELLDSVREAAEATAEAEAS